MNELNYFKEKIKKLEKENIQLKNQLNKSGKAEEDYNYSRREHCSLLTNMSHELGAPLNSIIGYCQLLQTDITNPLTPKQADNIEIITTNSCYLLEMINDILDLSKVETDNLSKNKQLFNIHHLLKKMPKLLSTILYKKQLNILIDIDSEIGLYNGNEIQIKQIIYNLLTIVIDFSSPETNIGLKCYYIENKLQIIIWRDEYSDFPETGLNTKFSSYKRLINPYKIIEYHSEEISVQNKINNRNQFIVTLPGRISQPFFQSENTLENPSPQNEIIMEKFDFKKSKILHIEDNIYTQEFIMEALEICNCEIDCVETGQKGFELASRNKYDLILMDIMLPDGSGIVFMKKIKKYISAYIPIIAFTAFAMTGEEEKYLKEGFDAYLSKPVHLIDLRKTLYSLLSL